MDNSATIVPTIGGGNAGRTVDNAGTRAHEAIDSVSAAAVPVVNRLARGAHQAVDNATQFASGAVETVVDKANVVRDAHARMADECRGHVRANPLASVGIALAAGYVLSRLLNRR